MNLIAEGILSLENYIAEKLPEDEARSRCIAATFDILPANQQTPYYPVGLEPASAFWANAQDAVTQLARDPAGVAFPTLMEQIRGLESFGNDEQWILFWSTIAANRLVYRKASAKEGESALTGVWLDGWEQQTSSWASDLVLALKCRVAMTYSRLFDTKGDYVTGSDVLMCFCSIRNDKLSIRLAWIQFKRGLTATDKLKVVHSEKFDQYKLLRRGHDPANGSTSVYSQLTSVLPSLATTAALDVDEVLHAINAQQGYDQHTVGPNQWRPADGTVNWQACTEPLATKLAYILRPHTVASTFSSLDDVRKWMEETYWDANPEMLPAYWAIQVMGDEGVSLKHLHELASEFHGIAAKLAAEFKLTLEELRPGLTRRPRGSQRDSGP